MRCVLKIPSLSIPIVLALFLIAVPAVSAQPGVSDVTITTSGGKIEVRLTAAFPIDALRLEDDGGCTRLSLPGCGHLKAPGAPMLPACSLRIALPEGMTVTNVSIERARDIALPVKHLVRPAQPPTPMNGAGEERTPLPPDPAIYESASAYPADRAACLHQFDLAGQNIALLRVCPVQYVPAEQRLIACAFMEIVLTGTPERECGDYLPEGISRRGRARYEKLVKGMVANPADVVLKPGRCRTAPKRGVAPGNFDYVIITPPDYIADFQPLADWRTQCGVPTAIVSTDWIHQQGGYSGSELERIRAFIQDAHSTWGAVSFLLGSDAETIPYHVRTITVPGYMTSDIANDTYLADFDDDWACEVVIGRTSVRNSTHVATLIDKIFTYEKNPPLDGYTTRAALFGFDITVPGDMDGEISKEILRGNYMPPDWTVDTEYDSEPGGHHADVLAYLEQGPHLVNHHDHCNTDCMGTGWTTHGTLMYNSHVDQLTNGDRLSIPFAVGCYPAHFPTAKCIAEAFLRNAYGGAVAFIGNTCIGWGGAAGDPIWYTVRQDHYFYRNLLVDGFETLGANFTDSKNDEWTPDDPYNLHMYCFTQLHLIGEPELRTWSAEPSYMQVEHAGALPVGTPCGFTVTVLDGGAPLEDATVCLWKAGDVYAVETTDASGQAVFSVTPTTSGIVLVTASKHNYISCESSTLAGGPIPDIKANGSDGPLSVTTADDLEFTIALDPGVMDGVDADWWVWAEKDASTTWWAKFRKGLKPQWTKSLVPIRFAGATLRTVTGYSVLGPRTLPAGNWIFGFAVDQKDDTYEGTYADAVEVSVF